MDLSRFAAGPYASWLLARLGAEVIRIDNPRGEFDRYAYVVTPTGENTLFLTLVSGKKSITLDLEKGDKAKALFDKLVAKSDVVIDNLVDVPESWGLDYESLSKIKPDIIFVHISGFGSVGPYKGRIGFDSVGQAMSGLMSLTGTPDVPIKGSVPYVDFITATNSCLGVVCALFHRYKTGKGQKIDVSLLRSAVSISSPTLAEYAATGRIREPRRLGNRTYWVSFSDLCWTKDGKGIYLTAMGPQLRRLFRAMGRQDLIDDPRLGSDSKAFENRQFLDPLVKEWVASKTIDEMEEIALKYRISIGPYLDYTEVADHPQVKAEEMLVEASLSDGSFKMFVPACPIRFSEEVFRDNSTIPKLGEDNEEIWGKVCGLSSQELAEFMEEGII